MTQQQILIQQERTSFERAVLPLRRSLRGAALRLSRSAAEADDLVQETVLKAWRFWSRYQERESCSAWLHRILKNTFISQRRRSARERQLLLSAHAQSDTHQNVAREQVVTETVSDAQGGVSDEVASGLQSLPREQRKVLWMVDVEERSYEQAAAALHVPLGTVMSRLHRARRRMRVQLGPAAALHA